MFVYAAHSSRRRPGARSGGSRSWPAWRNGCVADAPQFTVLADGGGMSRDERMGICRGGARAILVSSESPVSRGHEYRKKNEIEPAGEELAGGGALCPGWRGFAMQSSGKHAGALSVARSRKEPPPAISSHLVLPHQPLSHPDHSCFTCEGQQLPAWLLIHMSMQMHMRSSLSSRLCHIVS